MIRHVGGLKFVNDRSDCALSPDRYEFVPRENAIKAWYVSEDSCYLSNRRPSMLLRTKMVTGRIHKVNLRLHALQMCSHGLHASRRLEDARTYRAFGMIWQVSCWGHVLLAEDKLCAEYRQYHYGTEFMPYSPAYDEYDKSRFSALTWTAWRASVEPLALKHSKPIT